MKHKSIGSLYVLLSTWIEYRFNKWVVQYPTKYSSIKNPSVLHFMVTEKSTKKETILTQFYYGVLVKTLDNT